jgi:GT2 family glycosyltransferase
MNGIAVPIVAAQPPEPLESLRPRRTVSVIMVVYMTGEALGESLGCVLADPLVDELVVVDNGSDLHGAACLAEAERGDARMRVISGHGNIGFARAANLGARAATGELLVFLNPDAFLQAGCVAELAREVERRPGPCIVGGRVLNADRSEQRGARRGEITPVSALLSLSRLARRAPGWRRYEVHLEQEALPDRALAVPTISGACFCMRRADFDAVGGFDEGYFLHVEDVDLCWRVRQQGGLVLFHPRAEVVHLGHTSQVSPLKVEFHKGVGLARYFVKRAPSFGARLVAFLLSPLIVCTAVARPLMWRLKDGA